MEVVGLMKVRLLSILMVNTLVVYSEPLVQSITNKTQVGFEIVSYADKSECSAHLKNLVIDCESKYYQEFLLERGVPSLVLRPVYFIDYVTGQKVDLVDATKQFDDQKIKQAYELWKKAGNKKKFVNAQDWFTNWIGKDISVTPHTNEVIGYLINLSRVHIANEAKNHGTWLSISKGVFAKLILEIDILQHARKGVIPQIKVIAGEGGICSNGIIERL